MLLQWPHLCLLLTVHIGICDGNVHQVRGKQHNGLWLAGSAEWAALNNGAHWDQINKGYSFRWNWRNGEEEMRAYFSDDSEKWFSIMVAWTHEAFRYSYFSFPPIFPFIPVSVNAFSTEIGQSRAYKTLSLYYNVQTFSFIRSGSSSHLTLSISDTDSEYTNWRLNKLWYSPAACNMPRIVMPYYHVFNKWLTKHLLERCAGHETVWDTRPPYKCLEPLNTFPAHVYFKSNRPWKSSRRGDAWWLTVLCVLGGFCYFPVLF